MRKTLIAAIVASALFAVGAFAASFTVASEDIASGSDAVEACADHVDITFTTEPNDDAEAPTFGQWYATQATATFYKDADPDPAFVTLVAADCEGYDAKLALVINDVATVFPSTGTIPVGSNEKAVFPLGSPGQLVGDITNASVVVGGKDLTADLVDPTPTPE